MYHGIISKFGRRRSMENDLFFYDIILFYSLFSSNNVGFNSLFFLPAVHFLVTDNSEVNNRIYIVVYQRCIISSTKSFPWKSKFRKYCELHRILLTVVLTVVNIIPSTWYKVYGCRATWFITWGR